MMSPNTSPLDAIWHCLGEERKMKLLIEGLRSNGYPVIVGMQSLASQSDEEPSEVLKSACARWEEIAAEKQKQLDEARAVNIAVMARMAEIKRSGEAAEQEIKCVHAVLNGRYFDVGIFKETVAERVARALDSLVRPALPKGFRVPARGDKVRCISYDKFNYTASNAFGLPNPGDVTECAGVVMQFVKLNATYQLPLSCFEPV